MRNRALVLGGAGVLALIGAAVALTTSLSWNAPWGAGPAAEVAGDADEVLPVPPVPPRIADGADYEHCMAMVNDEPVGARTFAEAWLATGGGEGARHCAALAQVSLGEADLGATALDRLAAASAAPAAARAAVYGQAGQAWMMAGLPDRALASVTLALSMTPDDTDLLIDRSVASATLERYGEAVGDLTHALEVDGRRADALVLRAAALRHLNRLDAAQADVDLAFAMDPENADALLERGILRQRRGDRAGARADWEHAMELSPDSATGDLAQQNLALLDAGPERR